MKILCLQLARFGDIYQTWPALNALRRQYPTATIDLLVRERFVGATKGLNAVDRVFTLPTKDILAPILSSHARIDDSLAAVGKWLGTFKDERYDRICNLSFSPTSSYITECLSSSETLVTGYTRFNDGFLNIPDDASSYFYAQVGADRTNRIHLTDIFGLVAGVEIVDSDLVLPKELITWPARLPEIKNEFVVLHTGASIASKRCSSSCWQEMVTRLLAEHSYDVVLVGSKGEDGFLTDAQRQNFRIVNLIGQTELPELFGILAKAKALIAGDSVAIHMASLTDTPTLNISFASVRFWETGPRAKGSRVLWFQTPNEASAARVTSEFTAMIENRNTSLPIIVKNETFGVLYSLIGYDEDLFSWELTRALYMSQPFPITSDASVVHAFQRLGELAQLGLEQIRTIEVGAQIDLASSILDQIDHLVAQVDRLVPTVGPVVRWFQAEKSRIGPGAVKEILAATRQLFQRLCDVSHLYSINQKMNDSFQRENLTWKS
jgi:heptosyltransferase III